jgi:hypothetical protein
VVVAATAVVAAMAAVAATEVMAVATAVKEATATVLAAAVKAVMVTALAKVLAAAMAMAPGIATVTDPKDPLKMLPVPARRLATATAARSKDIIH